MRAAFEERDREVQDGAARGMGGGTVCVSQARLADGVPDRRRAADRRAGSTRPLARPIDRSMVGLPAGRQTDHRAEHPIEGKTCHPIDRPTAASRVLQRSRGNIVGSVPSPHGSPTSTGLLRAQGTRAAANSQRWAKLARNRLRGRVNHFNVYRGHFGPQENHPT